nr:unnamed protein product [Spirometra erinaceieuropaei]
MLGRVLQMRPQPSLHILRRPARQVEINIDLDLPPSEKPSAPCKNSPAGKYQDPMRSQLEFTSTRPLADGSSDGALARYVALRTGAAALQGRDYHSSLHAQREQAAL